MHIQTRILTPSLAVALACGLASAVVQSTALAADAAVSVTYDPERTDPGTYAYEPDRLEVAVGSTVTWENIDDLADQSDNNAIDHPTNCSKGESKGTCPWSSFPLEPGGTASVTFPEPGTFHYYCAVHPYMTGVVVVGDGNPPGTGGDPAPAPTSDPAPDPDPDPAPTSNDTPESPEPDNSVDPEPDTTVDDAPTEDATTGATEPDDGSQTGQGAVAGTAPDGPVDGATSEPDDTSTDDPDGEEPDDEDDGEGSPGLTALAAVMVLGVGTAAGTQFRKRQ